MAARFILFLPLAFLKYGAYSENHTRVTSTLCGSDGIRTRDLFRDREAR